MKAAALILLAASLITGCATNEYASYTAAHTARTAAHEKRLDGIANIARESNDQATRIAAIITLGNVSRQEDQIAAPKNPLVEVAETGLKAYSTWAQTVFGILQLGRSTSAVSDTSIANGLTILTPTLGK